MCDLLITVCVCVNFASSEGFQKHLHKHKAVGEKTRKWCSTCQRPKKRLRNVSSKKGHSRKASCSTSAVCTMYSSIESGNINLHYLVENQNILYSGVYEYTILDSLVCFVYSEECSIFEEGGNISLS